MKVLECLHHAGSAKPCGHLIKMWSTSKMKQHMERGRTHQTGLTCPWVWSRVLLRDTPPTSYRDISYIERSGRAWGNNCLTYTNHGIFRALYLVIKWQRPDIMMDFSEKMCSCCLVSTICFFRRHLRAKVLLVSLFNWTCGHSTNSSKESYMEHDQALSAFLLLLVNAYLKVIEAGDSYQ